MTQALFIIRASSFANPSIPVYLGDAVDFNRRVSASISALSSGSLFPVGFIALTAQETAPTGWLVCDGTALSRTAFPALYAALGTRYGAGDGATTFNIPTQAQCVPPAIAPTPPQVVTGGAVEPVAPVVVPDETTNPTGGSGSGGFVGGRVPPFEFIFAAP